MNEYDSFPSSIKAEIQALKDREKERLETRPNKQGFWKKVRLAISLLFKKRT